MPTVRALYCIISEDSLDSQIIFKMMGFSDGDAPYRISQRVDNYIHYRPRYPQAILDLLIAECDLASGHAIADIGSGTGILSQLFLDNGNPVIGVEPDPDMRAGAEHTLRDYPNITSVAATAEATTLEDQSVDFVTAGQAFHWFDLQQARREFRRILVPQGWAVLVWNVRRATGTPFLDALQGFWETKRFWKPSEQKAQAGRLNPALARQWFLAPFFGPGAYAEKVYANPLVCDFEGLKGRILSNKPALEPADPGFTAMIKGLEEMFQAHQQNGTVTIDHDAWVVYGQLPSDLGHG